ncbi:cellulase family glycosylhydrolase [Calothrix sp. PCC 6303]|uniref:cellulase family glycosylhydrolase n=1 Tax=Calothrix sp. PCC 6303 TaxID=1170562 RepID=UPI0002A037DC|nr:cellulase family glycosylhydrolase [Calothrix sp. PCC 6303]AFZ01969.1 glycoside hydrolase family 5 [Calothrix sp. PCC 6303]
MRHIWKRKRQKSKLYQKFVILSVAIAVFFGGILPKLPIESQSTAAVPPVAMQLPLSTRGAKIVDAKGKTVLLRGLNWFGMETESHAPHGLWKRDYQEMLSQMKILGYNVIRFPYSVEALRSTEVRSIDYNIGRNAELQGKTPLEVMDLVIQAAEKQGLLILLDSHRLSDKRIPPLWYGDGFTEADWIDTWKMLAQRYKNQANVIGADLKNEPHGKASWGTSNLATDWRLAAERAGNAILGINPNWLIVVEGVADNVPGQKLKHHWQGGNLEGVRRYPVRLSRRNKLVYSPHEYGPGVYKMPYFQEKGFPGNMRSRWETGFYYIARKQIAPILIGEFGGRNVDTKSTEGIWQNQLVKFIAEKNLSYTYWSWNPNSGDTGGVLLDDWQTVDVPKQVLLSKILPVKFNPPSIAVVNKGTTPSQPPKPSQPIPQNYSFSPLQVTTEIDSDWESGYCMSLKISNPSNSKIQNWQLRFSMNQAEINQSWNANFQQQAKSKYIVTPLDWGKVIEPTQVRDIGFCAKKLGNDYQPQKIEIIKGN